MKCPKCGYHSFEHLDNCKKCGQGLSAHKEKYNLRGFVVIGETAPTTTPAAVDEESIATFDTSDNASVDFGFDFLDEEEGRSNETSESVSLDSDNRDISLDQPFSVDGETVPADTPTRDKNQSDKV